MVNRGHEMRLNNESFNAIKNNKRTIEIRLFDEKRKSIKINDIIKFNLMDYSDNFEVRVIGLMRFKNIDDLFNNININNADSIDNIKKFYTSDEIKKYGLLGIVIEKI